MINARLNQELNTAKANVGDSFTMTVVPPYPSGDPLFQGATITGEVTKVQRAGQGRNAEIVIVPRYLRLADGSNAYVHGSVTSIAANKSSGETAGKSRGRRARGNADRQRDRQDDISLQRRRSGRADRRRDAGCKQQEQLHGSAGRERNGSAQPDADDPPAGLATLVSSPIG